MQYQEGRICSMRRTLCNVRGDVQYQNDHICCRRVFGLSIKSAVSGMSHLQYDERSMQYQESCICSTRRRLCSVKCTVSESLICSRKTGCVVREESLQYQECNICNTLRESVPHQEKFVHCEENIVQCEEKVYSIKRVHFQQEDSLCGWKRKSAVLGISHLKCAEKKYALPEGLHLQYEAKVMQYQWGYISHRITMCLV